MPAGYKHVKFCAPREGKGIGPPWLCKLRNFGEIKVGSVYWSDARQEFIFGAAGEDVELGFEEISDIRRFLSEQNLRAITKRVKQK